MKGRKPKSPGTRQRRNKSTSGASLPTESEAEKRKVPDIPIKVGGWRPEAEQAWYQFWRSPMADKVLKGDHFRIQVLLDMVDRYWRGETSLAPQIRLEGDSFGTSPLSRRRLEWEIRDRVQEELPVAAAGGAAARPVTKPGKGADDPRNVLRGDFKKGDPKK